MKIPAIVLALSLAATVATAATDPSAIGYVKTARGEAVVVRDGSSRPAQSGVPIRLGDLLRTGGDGALGVTFRDETRLSLQANTQLVVDEYVYEPDQKDASMVMKMAQGALQVVSGLIADTSPGGTKIKTPTATVGVRGTRVVVLLEE